MEATIQRGALTMRKIGLALAALALTGCDGEDPRITLCKAAVAETADSPHPVIWGDIKSEPLDEPAALREIPREQRPDIETDEDRRVDIYLVSLEYLLTDAERKQTHGGAACHFRRDPLYGFRSISITVGERHFDEYDLDRMTVDHLPVGAWQGYACKWYRFWERECRSKA